MTEPVGSLGEEASRLFAAAEEWVQGARAGSGADGDARPAAGHAGPECVICPLCQLLALARAARPEVVEHLAAAAGSLVSAARAAFEAAERGGGRPPSSRVEHIDIS
ncbi:MAG TPA: hypothetical protein VNA12_00080 [Mycobacteriales bacterium]|nr:hypothetical protein [Mycobacteriales bacterium]